MPSAQSGIERRIEVIVNGFGGDLRFEQRILGVNLRGF